MMDAGAGVNRKYEKPRRKTPGLFVFLSEKSLPGLFRDLGSGLLAAPPRSPHRAEPVRPVSLVEQACNLR